MDYFSSLSELLSETEEQVFQRVKTEKVRTIEEEDEETEEEIAQEISYQNSSAVGKLSELIQPKNVKFLFGDFVQGEQEIQSKKVASLCLLFSVLQGKWKESDAKFLITLATATPSISLIWNFIKSSPFLLPLSLSASLQAEGGKERERTAFVSALTLFGKILTSYLKAKDDESLFANNSPVSVQQLADISAHVKKIVHTLLLAYKKSGKSIDTFFNAKHKEMKESLVALLVVLHERNCRKPFLSDRFWECEELDSDSFFTELANERAEAREIIERVPFVVPFQRRVSIFEGFAKFSQEEHLFGRRRGFGQKVKVRRNFIFEDALKQFSKLSSEDLKASIRVEMIDENGIEETGVDGGGVFREFMQQ